VTTIDAAHRAATGVATYDRIAWSAPPVLKAIPTAPLPFSAVRHFGSDAQGPVQAVSTERTKNWDALMLASPIPGHVEARFCGTLVRTPIVKDLVFYLPAAADSMLEFPAVAGSLSLHLMPGYLDGFLDPERHPALPPVVARPQPIVAGLLRRIERELCLPGVETPLLVESVMRAIAIALASNDNAALNRPARIALTPATLRRVTDHVEAHLAEPIRLADMAAVAGLSMFHFSRVFKDATGETPYRYVHTRRLNAAKRLLATTRGPIAELALACGFASQSHFTSAFTRAMGITPAQYRRVFRID